MKKRKIFIGNYNVASQIADLKIAFDNMGIETLTATYGSSHADQGIVDYDFSKYPYYPFNGLRPTKLQLLLRSRFNMDGKIWRKALMECDTYIFIWNTFQYDFSDLEKLKKNGKKIITVFCGDDVRWYFAHKQEYERFGLKAAVYENDYDYSLKGLNKRLIFLRRAEKYSDFIFSRLDQAQLELRPYYRWNMMVNTHTFDHKPEQREVNPIVAHAPTDRKIKGTEHVLAAFERLKKEGILFTSSLIEKVNHNEAVKLYGNADIVIDQLFIPGTGKLATEALAMGKVVMGHMAYDKYPQKNPTGCPIVDVNPDTIYSKLKELILDYNKRKEIASKGRVYVLKYLDTGIFCRKVLDLFDGKNVEYDYSPTFFREQFVPESEEARVLYNKWTATVKECDWYNKYVSSGERAGLIF